MEGRAMSDDRDEQVRRLAEAVGNAEGPDWARGLAMSLYDAGARIPDPPRPSLPVVSEAAIAAFSRHYGGLATNSTEQGLRAAFPIILRDTVSLVAEHGIVTLRGTMDDVRTWRAMEGTKTIECAGVGVDLLISTLTGSDAHP